jgi:hypothetical protein
MSISLQEAIINANKDIQMQSQSNLNSNSNKLSYDIIYDWVYQTLILGYNYIPKTTSNLCLLVWITDYRTELFQSSPLQNILQTFIHTQYKLKKIDSNDYNKYEATRNYITYLKNRIMETETITILINAIIFDDKFFKIYNNIVENCDLCIHDTTDSSWYVL